MKELMRDGDAWLLVLLAAAGALPVLDAALHGRAWGAAATLGALIVLAALGALTARARVQLGAASLRRRLLGRGPRP